ncbi:MAG: class I SAM-dependent methyltransferase [Saprospiraceae bacterium]
MDISQTTPAAEQAQTMQRYYRLQSKIYDATRWTFLFGRKRIIRELPVLEQKAALEVLEVGCGTGYNLKRLALQFPNARLTGMDVSADMLELSAKRTAQWADRITLLEQPYGEENISFQGKFDLILFSYSLTMINPQWAALIAQAEQDLKPGGVIAVVDFFDSPFPWFKRHMAKNHVRMEGHLLPVLESLFLPAKVEIHKAYAGVWQYLVFIGRVG